MRTLICLFFLLFVQLSYAYNVPVNADTSKKHILDELAIRPPLSYEYNLSKNQFYLQYGFDAGAKRIISKFFGDRGKYIFYIVSPVIGLLFLLISYVLFIISLLAGGSAFFAFFFLFCIVAYALLWALRIYGIVMLASQTKRDLLYQLIQYRKTGNFYKGNGSGNTENDYYNAK